MNSKRNNNNAPQGGQMGRAIPASNQRAGINPAQVKGISAAQNSYKPLKINDEITIIPQPMSNASSIRSRGSLTITPHNASRARPSECKFSL